MNNLKIMFIAAGLFLSAVADCLYPEEYNLEKYLSSVEQNNRDLQIARKNADAAGETVRQAFAALIPSVGVSGGYTRNLKDVKEPTAVYAYDAGLSGIYPLHYEDVDSNYDNELQVALGVSQSLYDPAAAANYEQAKKNRDIQQTAEDYTRQSLLTAAKKLYAQVQLLDAIVTVRKETAETSEAVYLSIEKKYNAGTATELDLRMAEVDWKNDISAEAEAEKNAALGLMALKTLAGLPQNCDMSLNEKTETVPALPQENNMSEVLAARTDYRITLLSKDMADLIYKSSLTGFLPTVTGSFTLAYGQYGGYEGKDDWDAYDYTAAQLGIKIALPLFTGGYRPSKVKEAEIGRETARLQIQKKKDEIEQDLVSAQLRMKESSRKIESARALADASLRASSLARIAFENGLGTQLAVSQANTNTAQAKLNLQNAIYEYRTAYYDWESASGKVP